MTRLSTPDDIQLTRCFQ